MTSKLTVVLLMFLLIALIYLFYILYLTLFKNKHVEHFDSPETYDADLNVMNVFEKVLNRKATDSEIAKYRKYKNEQDILINVIKDYDIGKKDKVQPEMIIEEHVTMPTNRKIEKYIEDPTDSKICIKKDVLNKFLGDIDEKIAFLRQIVA